MRVRPGRPGRVWIWLLTVLWPVCAASAVWADEDEEVREQVRAGLAIVLSGDLAAAVAHWERLEASQPRHPAPPVFQAETAFWRIGLDDTDTALDAYIAERCTRAVELAQARVERSTDDAEAHLYLGQALIDHGRLDALRGRFLAAGTKGERGREHLEAALALAPARPDAKLPLGMYYYYASTVPDVLKWLSWLWFVPSGDGPTGLRYLEEVRRSGDVNRLSAQWLLLDVYRREKRHADALELARELRARFPNSSYLHLEQVELLSRAGDHRGALVEAQALIARDGTQYGDTERRALAWLWVAQARLALGRLEEAEAALASYGNRRMPRPRDARAWELLTRARLLDARNERGQALALYRQVAALDGAERSNSAARLASEHIEQPYRFVQIVPAQGRDRDRDADGD